MTTVPVVRESDALLTLSPGAASFSASVVIPTKNRKDELCVAIRSALFQSVPVEVLVMDDGSTDGTEEVVRREFPGVRYYRSEPSRGATYQRNRGAELASCEILFPIDDDAYFASPRTVEQALSEFRNGRVGALAIPFINILQDQLVRQTAADQSTLYATSQFIALAHAVRRSLFLRIGGYRTSYIYMGEEGDLCIRMLAAGFATVLARSDPLHHTESPKRDRRRALELVIRNQFLFLWYNVPFPEVLARWAVALANLPRLGIRLGHPSAVLRGAVRGAGASFREFDRRRPVSRPVYRLFRLFRRREVIPLSEFEVRLAATVARPDEAG